MSACTGCHKPVLWCELAPRGKPAPLNPDPSPRGNVRVTWSDDGQRARGRVLKKAELDKARAVGEPLYLNHFASCPQARTFRKR